MTPLADAVLSDARRFLSADYLPKIARCLDTLSEDDVWWRANPASNSIGNLILHLDGSTRMWVVGVAGGRPVTRDRSSEFAERGPIAKDILLRQLRATLAEVDATLAGLDGDTLLERRKSSREEVTVLSAILHAVEHFSMHTGQIILLAKQRSGADLKLSR
ncbi:MAG TPA: DinB family protein [Gemmatimonadaceae bacterium]|nr:DinB family protein [Gemmatimonadaceae bacterium]